MEPVASVLTLVSGSAQGQVLHQTLIEVPANS